MESELETIREHLTRFRAVTLQALALVPESELERTDGDVWSPGRHFAHIAQVEQYYVDGFARGNWETPELGDTSTRAAIEATLERTRAATLRWLDGLDEETLPKGIAVPGIPVPWPLRGWLWYLVEHEVHHKAQVAAQLRARGIEPPFFAAALPPGMRPDRS